MKILAVVGPPASGKTTVINLLHKITKSRIVHLAIDDAHHEVCDPTKDDARYSYSNDGMLILHDRDAMMQAAFLLVNAKILNTMARWGNALLCVEFASDDYRVAFKSLPAILDRDIFVLEVLASRATLETRNARRDPRSRVPTDFLVKALQGSVRAGLSAHMSAGYESIFNEEGTSLQVLETRVYNVLTRWNMPVSPRSRAEFRPV